MTRHKAALAAWAAVTLWTLAASAPGHASQDLKRTMHLTFSGAVGLPGVTLSAGTYIFERADPMMSADIVRVLSPDRRQVYFTAFTERVSRPAPRGRTIVLGEAPRGAAPPILEWYPMGESRGHGFVYDHRR